MDAIDFKAINVNDIVFDSVVSTRGSTVLKPKTFHTQSLNLLLYPVKLPFGVDFQNNRVRCDLKQDEDGELTSFLQALDARCEAAVYETFAIDDKESVNYIPLVKGNRYFDMKLNKHARTQKLAVRVNDNETLRAVRPDAYYDVSVELVYLYLLPSNKAATTTSTKTTAGSFVVVKQIKEIVRQ